MLCCVVWKSPGHPARARSAAVDMSCCRVTARLLGHCHPLDHCPGCAALVGVPACVDSAAFHCPDIVSLQTSFCRRIDLDGVRFCCAVCAESPGQDAPARDDRDTPTSSVFLTRLGAGDGDVQVTRHHFLKFETGVSV